MLKIRTSLSIRCVFKKYADCLNCAAPVGSRGIRLVSLGFYTSAEETPFPDWRYRHVLVGYAVFSEVCFLRLSDFGMDDLKEQRLAVKFCVKLGKNATETFAMLNRAYGDVAMKRTACFRWHERFKCGRQSIEDNERPGRPSTSTDDPHVDRINSLVRANRRLTIRELAEECEISVGSCHEILTEKLKMHRVAAKFVPRLMTDDQKANRVQVCQELLDRSEEDENFLSRIITGDESWVYGYDIETKVQSSQWVGETSPRPKKLAKFDPTSRSC